MPHYKPKKLFTVEEANKSLPLVRAIVQDMVALSQEMTERTRRLAELGLETPRRQDVYSEELVEIGRQLQRDKERLGEFVEELQELGIEPKSAPEGLVDFPAIQDGKIVFLCWRLGEPRVEFWHDLDAGFAGRMPIEELTGAGLP